MFLILQTGDTLGTDTTNVVSDTAEVLKIYDIPEILCFDHHEDNLQTSYLRPLSIVPDFQDITLCDAFFYTPYTVLDRGPALPNDSNSVPGRPAPPVRSRAWRPCYDPRSAPPGRAG